MRRALMKLAVAGALSVQILSSSTRATAQPIPLASIPSLTELLAKEEKNPVLASYKVIVQRENKSGLVLGRARVRENSLEAGLKPLFSITFYQPDDSTFIEQVSVLGSPETYLYRKRGDSWQFLRYEGSFFRNNNSKREAEGLIYPPGTTMQLENIRSLFRGVVADTITTFVMQDTYFLYKRTDKATPAGRYLQVDFIDPEPKKGDYPYINDPAEGLLGGNNIPLEAKVVLTDDKYRKGELVNRKKMHLLLELEYLNEEELLRAYGGKITR